MYFVVFFVGIRENRTVPHAWIRNVNDYIESFINNGLNRNRLYFCFWTDHPDAFDDNGTPRATYKINHQASVRNDFPHEGFYRCHIKKFHCNLMTALKHQERSRNIPPVSYKEAEPKEPKQKRPFQTRLQSTSQLPPIATGQSSSMRDLIAGPRRRESSTTETAEQRSISSEGPLDDFPANITETSTENVSPSHLTQQSTAQATEQTGVDSSESPNITETSTENVSSSHLTQQSTAQAIEQTGVDSSESPNITETSTENVSSSHLTQQSTAQAIEQTSVDSSESRTIKQEPLYSTSIAHLGEIQHLQSEENQSQIQMVRRLSANIFASTSTYESLNQNIDSQNLSDDGLDDGAHNTDANDDSSGDDCIITGVIGTVFRPLPSTDDELIKRENDRISGDISYIDTKDGRVYKIGSRLMEIGRDVVKSLNEWNEPPMNNDLDLDYRFAMAVFLSLVSPDDILRSDIDPNIMDFVKGLMSIRTNNNVARVSAAQISINAYCSSKRQENQAKEQTGTGTEN